MGPGRDTYVLMVSAEYIVPVLSFGHTVIYEPGNDCLLGRLSLAIVYSLEDATAPLAVTLDAVLVGGLI